MTKKRLLVLSADAMVTEDLGLLSTLPNFRRILAGGVRAERIQGIYPSLTYPAHVSILTGCYPDRHGVLNNLIYTEDLHCGDWEWDFSAVRVKDLFAAAKEAGYSTASILWPVSGNNPNVDYLINEAWVLRPGETPEQLLARYGSSPEIQDIVGDNLFHLASGYEKTGMAVHPQYDDFGVGCAAEIIRRFRPEILFLHACPVDAARHKSGTFGGGVGEAVRRIDRYIGLLAKALEDAGVLEQTNFVLLSDHGQMDCTRMVNLNAAFRQAGLLTLREDGTLAEGWEAYARAAGMSAYVYLRRQSDRAVASRVRAFLEGMAASGVCGISRVFTREEAGREERLGGDFAFVVETDGRTAFGNSCEGPFMRPLCPEDPCRGLGQHGYLPDKGPQPVFLAKGPDLARNTLLPAFRLVDEAPSFARLLGVELPGADGHAVDNILRGD